MNVKQAGQVVESNISPWLRLISPILLALILYILNGVDVSINELQADVRLARSDLAANAERIRSNETAIEIYHLNNRFP